jgi:ketosteroid isomerase-like protein
MREELAMEKESEDGIRREILEFSEEWAKALASNDAGAIGSFMSDDWVIVGQNGITKKEDFLPFVESGELTHEKMELAGEARIKIYGDTAVLTARLTNNGHFRGRAFSADEWTTDVFRRQNGRWLCVLSHITPV